MAQKYREEVVGKRFLALRTPSPGETAVSKTDITKSDWIRGVIRASTEKEASSKDIQVWYSYCFFYPNYHHQSLALLQFIIMCHPSLDY